MKKTENTSFQKKYLIVNLISTKSATFNSFQLESFACIIKILIKIYVELKQFTI